MKLTAMHGFSLGGGRDVAPGQVFAPESDTLGRYLIRMGSAFLVADDTTETTTGATITTTPSPATDHYPPEPVEPGDLRP